LEKWGTGTLRIIEACQEQGLDEPTREHRSGYVVVTFKRPKLDNGISQKTSQKTAKTSQKTSQKIKFGIIEYLKMHPTATRKELVDGIEGATVYSIKYNLSILRTKGIISHSGPNKGGRWVVNDVTKK
jgi:ATP-dependent DNA helicase RecG